MKVLLASTYELGHQPLHLASPAAALSGAGHQVRTVDLSVKRFDREDLEWSDGLAFSVPMHTAMRLATRAARMVKAAYPRLPVCAYGLYAGFGLDSGESPFDHAVSGEYEPGLLRWADEIRRGRRPRGSRLVELGKTKFHVPSRTSLPPLERYAHLQVGDERRKVGNVEASHGCRHRRRHCPIPVVYEGRIRVVDEASVLADIGQLVELGASHVTFGDADFFNAPAHSLRVVRAMHAAHPHLTFDLTTKVELIIRHAALWPELAASGLLFVVSAFETTNDQTLRLLDKGHTRADEEAAVRLLRGESIEIRPTWLPFTPWTSLDDLRDLVRFVVDHRLIGNVDPVQLTIRLLIPRGSLLLDLPELVPYLDAYDEESLGWRWHAADPRMDALHARLTELHKSGVADGLEGRELFAVLAGEIMGSSDFFLPVAERSPRLTEPWFC